MYVQYDLARTTAAPRAPCALSEGIDSAPVAPRHHSSPADLGPAGPSCVVRLHRSCAVSMAVRSFLSARLFRSVPTNPLAAPHTPARGTRLEAATVAATVGSCAQRKVIAGMVGWRRAHPPAHISHRAPMCMPMNLPMRPPRRNHAPASPRHVPAYETSSGAATPSLAISSRLQTGYG